MIQTHLFAMIAMRACLLAVIAIIVSTHPSIAVIQRSLAIILRHPSINPSIIGRRLLARYRIDRFDRRLAAWGWVGLGEAGGEAGANGLTN